MFRITRAERSSDSYGRRQFVTVVAGEQSPGVPATDRTLYSIASLTKPIVAETILRLASQNKLQLDESIYPYWVSRISWNRNGYSMSPGL
jgi:CubicO group peptidase (beta-lactamase class C family)